VSNNVSNIHSIGGTRYEQLVSDDELPVKFQRALYFNTMSGSAKHLLYGALGLLVVTFLVCCLRSSQIAPNFSSVEDVIWSVVGLASVALALLLALWIHRQEEILTKIREGKYKDMFKA
jgi:hypothetical protein